MSCNDTIRVLQILPGGPITGGIESFVLSYYKNIDRSKVQFDFLFNYKQKIFFEDEVKALGARVYYLSGREDGNLIHYCRELYSFFKEHPEYRIVHGHMPGFAPIYFFIAKLCGVKIRISHSHVTKTEPTLKGAVLKVIIKNIRHFSNVYWACSEKAGQFMYGSEKFEVIPNAVSFDRFKHDESKRIEMRRQINCSDNFVIGNVGRLSLQKNQSFLIKVFKEYKTKHKNAKLLLIGQGELENALIAEMIQEGIRDDVIMLHNQPNIEDYYQAMDVMVMPSIFEGLPITVVEGLACGVPCVVSKEITREVNLTGKVRFIGLDEAPARWVDAIEEVSKENMLETHEVIKSKGYEIKSAAQVLTEKYIALAEKMENEI